MNKRQIGFNKEAVAAQFLKENGYDIIAQNFNTKSGEIDIVAKNENYLCFIEVKYRKNTVDGYPEEAVDYRKIKKISKAARVYLLTHGYDEYYPCRFDVVTILDKDINIIKNAFEAYF